MHTAALVASRKWWGSTAVMGPYAAPSGVPATISAIVQDVWPPRVLITAQGLNLGHSVTIWRSINGVRTAVRGALEITTADVALIVLDAEQPFGVLITYILSVDGVDVDTTQITVSLSGNVAMTDAITGASAEVIVTAWPEKQKTRQSSTFQVGGRNIVVAGQRGGFSGSVDIFTETTTAAESVDSLLNDATSATIQFRQNGGYDRFDCYVSVLADSEKRFSQDGSDERRIWTLDVVEVDPWSSGLIASGFTYEDLTNAYVGLTYQDLAGDYSSYLALGQADLS